MTYFFFHTAANQYTARAYVKSEDADGEAGFARQVIPTGATLPTQGDITLNFLGDGTINTATFTTTLTATMPWSNGAENSVINIDLSNFTQYSANSNISSIVQDGKGVGTVTSLVWKRTGEIFAILSNGQTSIIGTVGLVNFANPEGLVRIGSQLLQQAPESGEPIVGRPDTGTLGAIAAGSVELSTVDIANEFVKSLPCSAVFRLTQE